MVANKKHYPLPLDTYKSWVVMFSTSLLFLYSYFSLNIFNPIEYLVAKDFNLTPKNMGDLSFGICSIKCAPQRLMVGPLRVLDCNSRVETRVS